MSKNNNITTINHEDLDQYIPRVGKCFLVYFEAEDKTLAVHPFYWEDEHTIEPDIVGGFNVYDAEDDRFLGSCEDVDEIENFLYKDKSNNHTSELGDTCYAHVIHVDDDEVALLVGDFTDEEVNEIITKFENDENLGDIDDQIVWVAKEEIY